MEFQLPIQRRNRIPTLIASSNSLPLISDGHFQNKLIQSLFPYNNYTIILHFGITQVYKIDFSNALKFLYITKIYCKVLIMLLREYFT